MDGGDPLDPTVENAHPEYSIHLRNILPTLHLCRTLWNTLEHTLEKYTNLGYSRVF